MSLSAQLDQDLKAAMLQRDEVRKQALRATKTAMQNALVEKRVVAGRDAVLTDQEVQAVIAKQAKQRRDSIAEFDKAGRTDLVEIEQAELAVLEEYLPRQMTPDEIAAVVQEIMAETGASSPQELGLVMRSAMSRLKGQADGKLVNQIARELLGESA